MNSLIFATFWTLTQFKFLYAFLFSYMGDYLSWIKSAEEMGVGALLFPQTSNFTSQLLASNLKMVPSDHLGSIFLTVGRN